MIYITNDMGDLTATEYRRAVKPDERRTIFGRLRWWLSHATRGGRT